MRIWLAFLEQGMWGIVFTLDRRLRSAMQSYLSRKIENFKKMIALRRHRKDTRNITVISGKVSVLSKWKSQEIQQSCGGNGISEEKATLT